LGAAEAKVIHPTKFRRKFFRNCAAGKTPQQVIAVIFMPMPDVCAT